MPADRPSPYALTHPFTRFTITRSTRDSMYGSATAPTTSGSAIRVLRGWVRFHHHHPHAHRNPVRYSPVRRRRRWSTASWRSPPWSHRWLLHTPATAGMSPTDGIQFGAPPRVILHTHTSNPKRPTSPKLV